MRRLGKAVKWVIVGLVVAEWYARSGREFVFGGDSEEWGIGEVIRTWVSLPQGTVLPDEARLPCALVNTDGDEIGVIREARLDEDARDMAGHPIERTEIFVEVAAEAVGRPINVALAEIESHTLRTLGL